MNEATPYKRGRIAAECGAKWFESPYLDEDSKISDHGAWCRGFRDWERDNPIELRNCAKQGFAAAEAGLPFWANPYYLTSDRQRYEHSTWVYGYAEYKRLNPVKPWYIRAWEWIKVNG